MNQGLQNHKLRSKQHQWISWMCMDNTKNCNSKMYYIHKHLCSYKLRPKTHLTEKSKALKSYILFCTPGGNVFRCINISYVPLVKYILAGEVAFPAVLVINHLLNRVITVAATLC